MKPVKALKTIINCQNRFIAQNKTETYTICLFDSTVKSCFVKEQEVLASIPQKAVTGCHSDHFE